MHGMLPTSSMRSRTARWPRCRCPRHPVGTGGRNTRWHIPLFGEPLKKRQGMQRTIRRLQTIASMWLLHHINIELANAPSLPNFLFLSGHWQEGLPEPIREEMPPDWSKMEQQMDGSGPLTNDIQNLALRSYLHQKTWLVKPSSGFCFI